MRTLLQSTCLYTLCSHPLLVMDVRHLDQEESASQATHYPNHALKSLQQCVQLLTTLSVDTLHHLLQAQNRKGGMLELNLRGKSFEFSKRFRLGHQSNCKTKGHKTGFGDA
jgi:hypothetical protein